MTASAHYLPARNEAQVSASISVSAGLGIDFDWAVVQGGGMLLLGVEADLSWRMGQGASLNLDLFLMAHGFATVLDILSVDIRLLMEVSYASGHANASGYLSYSVDVCPFVTIGVEEGVSYALVGSGGGGGAPDGEAE